MKVMASCLFPLTASIVGLTIWFIYLSSFSAALTTGDIYGNYQEALTFLVTAWAESNILSFSHSLFISFSVSLHSHFPPSLTDSSFGGIVQEVCPAFLCFRSCSWVCAVTVSLARVLLSLPFDSSTQALSCSKYYSFAYRSPGAMSKS